jgi:hypothetical protein
MQVGQIVRACGSQLVEAVRAPSLDSPGKPGDDKCVPEQAKHTKPICRQPPNEPAGVGDSALEFTVRRREIRTALSRPTLALASGFGAGLTYKTAPYVIVCTVGHQVVCEFPALSAEDAEEVAANLRREARNQPMREFLREYGAPSHVIDQVLKTSSRTTPTAG